jgi:hypothetical protein
MGHMAKSKAMNPNSFFGELKRRDEVNPRHFYSNRTARPPNGSIDRSC